MLGHKRCGAVQAALSEDPTHGNIKSLVDFIKPAVEKAKIQVGERVDNVTKENIRMVVEQIKTSNPILSEAVEQKNWKFLKCFMTWMMIRWG